MTSLKNYKGCETDKQTITCDVLVLRSVQIWCGGNFGIGHNFIAIQKIDPNSENLSQEPHVQ